MVTGARRRNTTDNPRHPRVELRLSAAQWYALHLVADRSHPSPFGERRTNTHTYGKLSAMRLIELRPGAHEWSATADGKALIGELRLVLAKQLLAMRAAEGRARVTGGMAEQARRDYLRSII